MNLTVPRDRLFEQPDGTWWFVVKGEMCHTATCSWGTARPKSPDCRCKGVMRPPFMLLDPDRTLTIETECETYTPFDLDPCDWSPYRCVNGTVSLGPFRIETPMPIVADSEDVGSAYWGPACIEAHANGARHYPAWDGALEYDDGQDINLGPDPARFVGQFAVKAVPA